MNERMMGHHYWKIIIVSLLLTLCPLVLAFTITGLPHHYSNYESTSTRHGMSMSSTSDGSERMSDKIIKAAADLTVTQSSLLGVKSLGVDYGLVRTGLGVTIGYEPTPIGIVSDLNNTQLSQHIIKLADIEKADQIIVGLPFHLNGTEAEQTIITREFASRLNCAVYAHFGPGKMPVYMWDERYTSKEAAARIRAVNPGADLYKELDADAACIILEYYYLDDGVGAQKIELPEDEHIREAVHQAWLIRKEEQERKLRDLTEMRMNTQANKKAMMERARLLDEKLAGEGGGMKKKKKKKKKR
jgi:putative Holliday junction resolvase